MSSFFRKFLILAVLVIASFLPILSSTVFGGTVTIDNPLAGDVDSITEFLQVVVSKIILPIGSVVIVIVFIYAGFLFVTAQGSESKLASAKHTFWWAVIGAAILLGSYVLAEVIQETVCQIAENTPGCN